MQAFTGASLVATFPFSHVSVIRFQIKPCYVGERPPLVTWLKNVLWDAKVKSRQDWHRSYRHRTSCSVLLVWTLLTQFSCFLRVLRPLRSLHLALDFCQSSSLPPSFPPTNAASGSSLHSHHIPTSLMSLCFLVCQ